MLSQRALASRSRPFWELLYGAEITAGACGGGGGSDGGAAVDLSVVSRIPVYQEDVLTRLAAAIYRLLLLLLLQQWRWWRKPPLAKKQWSRQKTVENFFLCFFLFV